MTRCVEKSGNAATMAKENNKKKNTLNKICNQISPEVELSRFKKTVDILLKYRVRA